jgi:hypothetical protein
MTYDEDFAQPHRRERLTDQTGARERAMFGGLAFLLDRNMAVGLSGDGESLPRVGPDATGAALARPHTRPRSGVVAP